MSATAMLLIAMEGAMADAAPVQGGPRVPLKNETLGKRWATGQGSDQIDTVHWQELVVAASGSTTINLLAAGSLEDLLKDTVDLDELKAVVVKCTAGKGKFVRASSNGVPLFTAAGEGVFMDSAGVVGARVAAFDLGGDGMDVSSAASFTFTETGGVAAVTFQYAVIGAS